AGRYAAELLVPEKSAAIGRRGSEVLPPESGDVVVLEIFRGGSAVPSPRGTEVEAGDRLLVRGRWDDIEAARRRLKLEHAPAGGRAADRRGPGGAESAPGRPRPGRHRLPAPLPRAGPGPAPAPARDPPAARARAPGRGRRAPARRAGERAGPDADRPRAAGAGPSRAGARLAAARAAGARDPGRRGGGGRRRAD